MEAAVRWSPFSAADRQRFLLVDVIDQSLSLNQITDWRRRDAGFTQIARLGRLPNFGAFDWSKTDEGVVALGLVSGSACLVRLHEDSRPSQTIATFKLRQQRKCNSIAISTQNWLAVALDRTRADPCLNIFDASGQQESSQEPVRRLCQTEVVSSVRFTPSRPEELIVAARRACIRLYDLRDGYFGGSSVVQVATNNVHNIAIDPMDENYFASAGSTGDPNVTVWDKRWIAQTGSAGSGAVFDFQPAVDHTTATSVWSLRYSGQQRGRLAICSSRGELKVIDMIEGRSALLHASEYLPNNAHGGQPWSHNRYVSQIRTVRKPFDEAIHTTSDAKLIAFDWISADHSASAQNVLQLRPDRRVDIARIPRTIAQSSITPRYDISLTSDELTIVEPSVSTKTNTRQALDQQERSAEDFGPKVYEGETAHNHESTTDHTVLRLTGASQVANMLPSLNLHRERCRKGYLFDCAKNTEIVSGDWQLERLWEIVERYRQQAARNGMVAERQNLDLSYIGVAALCVGQGGPNAKRKLSPSSGKLEDAVADLVAARSLPPFEGERTHYPEIRQLCLEMCGWKFHQESLEQECRELADRDLHYQAVVQAVLHEYKHLALNLLRSFIRTKTIPNIGLGALLAADKINAEQREMCLWMAADTDDPALKALLTFLTTGDWRDVMKTNYLHLGYRVALGLKYLNDTELGGFIQSETARAVKNGDLEGILLTGLGEQSMALFQTYITKTNDLQTAVLATALTNPRYVDDARFEMWKETYFTQMQSWRTFTQRSQFIVQHGKMAQTPDGHSLLDPPAGQVSLRCHHCQTSLARHDKRPIDKQKTANLSAGSKASVTIAANAGIICPTCGRHMPRCGICRMWLGTPDPTKRGGPQEQSQLDNVMARFLTFCVSCEHGFHADHARSWFEKHSICPVPDCRCVCTVK